MSELPSAKSYLITQITLYVSGITAFGLGLYNRFTDRTLTLDIIAGLILGVAVICWMKKSDYDKQIGGMKDRYGR